MSTFAPTPEQVKCIDAFATGEPLVIEAGAGTGKTTTLRLIAESTTKRGQYLAYNRAIVDDVGGTLPNNVAASTAHSLAFRAVGKQYAHRLNSSRMKSKDIARLLGVQPVSVEIEKGVTKVLPDWFLAGHVRKAALAFCHTTDETPGIQHFEYLNGIDMPTEEGKRTYANNDAVRMALLPALMRAWDDLVRTDGQLTFAHDVYLKVWALSAPILDVDFVMLDEAQDADPVIAQIVEGQTHAQRVYVGDPNQEIYSWRGAVNALDRLTGNREFLTQSFRFGPAVADAANEYLDQLDASFRLSGFDQIRSTRGESDLPEDAVLCRSNAHSIECVFQAQGAGRSAHLVGGGKDIQAFAKAAVDLKMGRSTSYGELACFDDWDAVQHYVENDPAGSELRLMVNLVDKFGPQAIIAALVNMPSETDADLIVSTAHKAKGREWGHVRIGNDFNSSKSQDGDGPSDSELRLRYVAVTRAKLHLDDASLHATKEAAA